MKRFISCLAILLLLLSMMLTVFVHAIDLPAIPLTTSSSSQPTRIAGDANGDKNVDLRDVVLITRYLVGGWNAVIQTSVADVNADNAVDLKDVALIHRYIVGGWGVTLI